MTETRRDPPRLLLDEHVVAALAPALRERGVNAVHVLEEGLGGAPDPTLLRWCQAHRRILVTRNYKDFAPMVEMLVRRNEEFPGILFLSFRIPDDLLVGALAEVSRFGIAWIGEWAIDVDALENGASDPDADPATAYTEATVGLFERAAALAREEGSNTTGLVHLLAAFAHEECGLMAELRERHGFSRAEWRAALARGSVGTPPRLVSGSGGNGGATAGEGSTGPEILSVDQAAEYLGVHAQTVRNYIRSGKLPAYRLAGERYIRVLRKDLLALLERVPTDNSDEDEGS